MNARPLVIIGLLVVTAASIGVAITEHRTAREAAQEAAQQPTRAYIAGMEAELVTAKRDAAQARNQSQTLQTEISDLQNRLAEDAERLRYR